MVPDVATLIVMIFAFRWGRQPAFLGKNSDRGSRLGSAVCRTDSLWSQERGRRVCAQSAVWRAETNGCAPNSLGTDIRTCRPHVDTASLHTAGAGQHDDTVIVAYDSCPGHEHRTPE